MARQEAVDNALRVKALSALSCYDTGIMIMSVTQSALGRA